MAITHVLVLALLTQPGAGPAVKPIEYCESAVVAQARAALAALAAAERAHGGSAGGLTAAYEGTVAIEGHMMRPGAVRTIPVRLELSVDPGVRGLALREVSGPAASPSVETTLVLGGRVAQQIGADKTFSELGSGGAAETAADGALWTPSSAVRAALDAAPTCRPGPAIQRGADACSPVTFTDRAGRACTILLDGEGRVAAVERLSANQRLGDVCDWTRFEGWEVRDGAAVPLRVSRFIVGDSLTLRHDLSLVDCGAGPVARERFLLPGERAGDIPGWGERPPAVAGMEFVALAPKLWSVEIAAADSRVLVVEREKDLVVLGAPEGDAVCGALVAALGERFAGKPIGVAAFGHHHPSPSGGLRALAAAGATIVAPRALEVYVRDLLARPTSLGAPAVAAPTSARVEVFEQERTIDCGEMSVRLIDIGESSAHAFRYVVFYFPGPGILFEDDLGYFPENGAARVGPRLMGLADALEVMQIEPRRLVQLWPVKGVKREVEWPVVADLVRAERERQKVH